MPSLHKQSRYVVERSTPLGHLTVRRRDGIALGKVDEIWLKNIIELSLRSTASIDSHRSDTNSERRDSADDLLRFLSQEHKRRGLAFSKIGPLMGVHPHRLSEISKGVSRAFVDVVTSWAYLLGFVLIPVPITIRNQVYAMIREWYRVNHETEINWPEGDDARTSEGFTDPV